MVSRQDRLRARNDAQLAINNGTLNDPEFEKLLKELSPYRDLDEGTGDYYDVVIPKNKTLRESGKVQLVPKERDHGLGETKATFQALMAAEKHARSGVQVMPERDITRMAGLLRDYVTQGSISKVGMLGSRERPTDEEIHLRAAALLTDIDNGRDPKTGIPFNTMNSPGTMPLDAGHFIAHTSRPDLSNSPDNIGFQNAYENRGQASAEKIAGQQGREATSQELADALFKSYINKITSDVKLPRKNSKEYKELMAGINAKLEGY